MKTNRTLIVLALFMGWLAGQNVGIGTSSPHASARLHVSASDRGLLIPNVALSAQNSTTPIVSPPGPETSLLVYNTATAGAGNNAVSPGFYYWNGSRWVRLLTGTNGNGDAWLTTGNAGTSSATNFLGTTDAQDLVVRTNNTERMRVTSSGNVGIGTSTPTQRLHVAGNLRLDNAFMPGNQAGTSGQVLLSQGAGVAPIWGWALTKNDVYVAYSSATVDLTGNQWRDIAGPITLSLPAGAKVIAYASGSAVSTGVCYASADIRISVNGNDFPNGAYTGETVDYYAPWDLRESYSLMGVYDVPTTGTYTFRLQGWGPVNPSQSGCALRVGGDNNTFTQAVLIIMVLR